MTQGLLIGNGSVFLALSACLKAAGPTPILAEHGKGTASRICNAIIPYVVFTEWVAGVTRQGWGGRSCNQGANQVTGKWKL